MKNIAQLRLIMHIKNCNNSLLLLLLLLGMVDFKHFCAHDQDLLCTQEIHKKKLMSKLRNGKI